MAARLACVRMSRDLLAELNAPYKNQNNERIFQLMKDLKDREVDFPSATKQKILCYHLVRLLKKIKDPKSEHDMGAFVKALSPFNLAEAAPGGEQHQLEEGGLVGEAASSSLFDALNPTMGQLDGDLPSKVEFVQKILVKDLLNTLIEDGESSTSAIDEFVTLMSAHYESVLETLDEDVPDGVVSVLDLCRALHLFADPTDLCDGSQDELLTLVGAHLKDEEGLMYPVSLALQENLHFKQVCDDVMKKVGSSKIHLPKLRTFARKLATLSNDNIDGAEVVAEVLVGLPELRVGLRNGACYKVECLCLQWLEDMGTNLQKQHSSSAGLNADDLPRFLDALGVALEQWPQARTLEDLMLWGRSVAETSLKSVSESRVAMAIEACVGEGDTMGVDALARLERVLDDFPGVVLTNGHRMEIASSFVLRLSKQIRGNLACAPLVKLMEKAVALLPAGSTSGATMAEVQLTKLGIKLQVAYDKYMEGGDSLADQASDDADHKKIRSVIRNLEALQQHVREQKGQSLDSNSSEVLPKLARQCECLAKEVYDHGKAQLVKSLQADVKSCGSVAGGGADGKAWHQGLEGGASLDQVLETSRATVLGKKAAWYKDSATKIARRLQEMADFDEMFSITGDDHCDLRDRCQQLSRQLHVTYIEGMLCHLFLNEKDRKVLQKKVRGIQANAKDCGVVWDDIRKELRDRCGSALKLKVVGE